MTDAQSIRDANLAYLNEHGFTPATWMPLPAEAGVTGEDAFAGGVLRPLGEIASRYCSLLAVFAWGSAPPNFEQAISRFIEGNQLRSQMTEDETKIIDMPKSAAAEEHAGTVGWRLENMWSLAWILGLTPPPSAITGQLSEQVSGSMLNQFLPDFDVTVQAILDVSEPRSVDEVIRMQDLFYLAHNAVRGGQLGQSTVPDSFDPIGDGGAIHERRHSLTWALSPGLSWDETDLST